MNTKTWYKLGIIVGYLLALPVVLPTLIVGGIVSELRAVYDFYEKSLTNIWK